MTDHNHCTFVEGCYRCDLSREEAAADEIVRLRAEVERLTNGNNVMGLLWNAERALADQLAAALRAAANVWGVQAHVRSSVHPVATAALDAYEAARKEEQ